MAKRGIIAVRELVKADLARLIEPRKVQQIQRIKDSHHYLARLFAAGLDIKAVAARTGYSYHRIAHIRKSPAFDQLVAEYRNMVCDSWLESLDDYHELATANMVRAELQIADRLAEAEDAGETLPVRDLIAISRDAADRFGYGKKQTNINLNGDFASALERAIRQRDHVVIEASASTREPGGLGEVTSRQSHASPTLIEARAEGVAEQPALGATPTMPEKRAEEGSYRELAPLLSSLVRRRA